MSNSVLPGDKIAVIEEYEAGNNTCDDGHIVRAAVIGQSEIDKKERVVNVKNLKSTSIPEKGDIIIEIEGKSISNIYDYMYRLAELKTGQSVEVTIQRGDKELKLILNL